MTLDEQIRSTVAHRKVNLPSLPTPAEIGDSGRLRRARRRAGLGVSCALLVLGGFAAMATLGSSTEEGTVFAGQETVDFRAGDVVQDGSRLLSMHFHGEGTGSPGEETKISVVESYDGLIWNRLPGSTRSIVLAEGSGTLILNGSSLELIALVKLSAPAPDVGSGDELKFEAAVRIVAYDLAAGNWVPDRDVSVPGVEPGVTTTFRETQVAHHDSYVVIRSLETFASPPWTWRKADTVCGGDWRGDTLLLRSCGSDEFVPVDPQREYGGAPTFLVLAFDRELDREAHVLVEEAGSQSLYDTDGGVGLTGPWCRARCEGIVRGETADGETWDLVQLPVDEVAWMAASGDQRIASEREVSVVGSAGTRLAGSIWYRPIADASTWQEIDLGPLLEPLISDSGFESGELGTVLLEPAIAVPDGGWLIPLQVVGDARRNLLEANETQAFVVQGDRGTLEGTLNFGPAVLRDEQGRVITRWEVFEPTHPHLMGSVDASGNVELGDPGDPVRFDFDDWAQAITSDPDARSAVLYSPDGVNWQRVDLWPGRLWGQVYGHDGRIFFHPWSNHAVSRQWVELPELD